VTLAAKGGLLLISLRKKNMNVPYQEKYFQAYNYLRKRVKNQDSDIMLSIPSSIK